MLLPSLVHQCGLMVFYSDRFLFLLLHVSALLLSSAFFRCLHSVVIVCHLSDRISISILLEVIGQWWIPCFSLSWKDFISSSSLKDSLAAYNILGWQFFSFRTLNISPHSLLSCKISAKKSALELMNRSLYITWAISFAAFGISILYFSVYLFATCTHMYMCMLWLCLCRSVWEEVTGQSGGVVSLLPLCRS